MSVGLGTNLIKRQKLYCQGEILLCVVREAECPGFLGSMVANGKRV